MLDIDAIPLCVVVYELDSDGDFIFKAFNKKAEATEKITKEELLGEKLEVKFPGIRAMGLIDLFERVYKSGITESLDLGLYEDNRVYGWKKNTVSKLSDTSILVIFEDVTKENPYVEEFEKVLKQKTEALQELTDTLQERVQEEVDKREEQFKQLMAQSRLAQMGEMISMIAHQWRQPLGAISATSANLKLKLELETFDLQTQEGRAKEQEYFLSKLSNIEDFVQSLTTTIDDFRNFYKPNKHASHEHINKAFEHAFHIMESAFSTRKIELIKQKTSTKKVEFYESELTQVLLNILKNAQDNFDEKGIEKPKLYISCEDTKDGVDIKISDNGGGIDDATLEKIFDPYFSTKEDKNGTGLGLYMSKMIIEEHHQGELFAKNTPEGVCFTIRLKEKILPSF